MNVSLNHQLIINNQKINNMKNVEFSVATETVAYYQHTYSTGCSAHDNVVSYSDKESITLHPSMVFNTETGGIYQNVNGQKVYITGFTWARYTDGFRWLEENNPKALKPYQEPSAKGF